MPEIIMLITCTVCMRRYARKAHMRNIMTVLVIHFVALWILPYLCNRCEKK